MLVLFWIISSAVTQKKTPSQGQPWDQSRRRQSAPPVMEPKPPIIETDREVKRPTGPFPSLQDLGKEIREVLLEVNGELEPANTERKRLYRVKTVPEIRNTDTICLEPALVETAVPEKPRVSVDNYAPANRQVMPFDAQTVVQGFIMSELLQPPRSKRPLRQ